MTLLYRCSSLLLVLFLNACTESIEPIAEAAASKIVVYSERKDHLIKPLFDLYTEETGVEIEYLTGSAAPLISRLQQEGKYSPADILLTVDAGSLWQAANLGLLQPLQSKLLENNIPSHLRDPQMQWVGLSLRARTIVFNQDVVAIEQLISYEGLADAQWLGRLCLRSSKKVYNQSLVATMIAGIGEQRTEQVVKGWVNNLATDVYANDVRMMEAINAGLCDVGITNSYYFGRMQRQNKSGALALFWPNQKDRGVHVNISGGGVLKHAPNAPQAQALLEWLSQDRAQAMFAELNLEYPANPNNDAVAQVLAWGEFKQDPINIAKAGELQVSAVRLMDRAGYR